MDDYGLFVPESIEESQRDMVRKPASYQEN